MMFLNTTCFSNLEPSNVKLFDMTVFGTIGVGVVIGVTALIGFIIRMLFLYYRGAGENLSFSFFEYFSLLQLL